MACIRERRGRLVIDFYDQTGARRWKTLKEGTTKTQAKDILTDLKKEVKDETFTIPSDKRFDEVADEWLMVKKTEIRAHTLNDYESRLRNYLKPHFTGKHKKSIKIQKIDKSSVRRFISDNIGKLTIPTINKSLIVLGSVMEFARDEGYINSNPVRGVKKPKRDTQALDNGNGDNGEINILTSGQIKSFLDAIPETEIMHKTMNMLAVFTGLRQGEILGLKWQDIDFENSQLEVKRSFTHGDFFKPKSKASLRKVDIPPILLSQLRKWKIAQQPNNHDLVFATGRGNPIFGNNMPREMFTPYLKKAGLPTVNFHSLRHSYASLLIEQGENIKYIQKQLGHSRAVVTIDIYGHLMEDSNPEASIKLQEKIYGSKMVAE